MTQERKVTLELDDIALITQALSQLKASSLMNYINKGQEIAIDQRIGQIQDKLNAEDS